MVFGMSMNYLQVRERLKDAELRARTATGMEKVALEARAEAFAEVLEVQRRDFHG